MEHAEHASAPGLPGHPQTHLRADHHELKGHCEIEDRLLPCKLTLYLVASSQGKQTNSAQADTSKIQAVQDSSGLTFVWKSPQSRYAFLTKPTDQG